MTCPICGSQPDVYRQRYLCGSVYHEGGKVHHPTWLCLEREVNASLRDQKAKLRSIAERALQVHAFSMEGSFEQRSLRAELDSIPS